MVKGFCVILILLACMTLFTYKILEVQNDRQSSRSTEKCYVFEP